MEETAALTVTRKILFGITLEKSRHALPATAEAETIGVLTTPANQGSYGAYFRPRSAQ